MALLDDHHMTHGNRPQGSEQECEDPVLSPVTFIWMICGIIWSGQRYLPQWMRLRLPAILIGGGFAQVWWFSHPVRNFWDIQGTNGMGGCSTLLPGDVDDHSLRPSLQVCVIVPR